MPPLLIEMMDGDLAQPGGRVHDPLAGAAEEVSLPTTCADMSTSTRMQQNPMLVRIPEAWRKTRFVRLVGGHLGARFLYDGGGEL